MNPLIKWPGGKSREIRHIKELIPRRYDRYIEPFFGGGAVFFNLQPKKAIINDICDELVLFYKFIKGKNDNELFSKELNAYATQWTKIDDYVKPFSEILLNEYSKFRYDSISKNELTDRVATLFNERLSLFNELFSNEFCIDKLALENELRKNIVSKLRRIKKLDAAKKMSQKDLKKQIETGFRSGFYTHFRNLMNSSKLKNNIISNEKRIANYYFIREFCYASMFRFNKKGEFNIPYGGAAYNKKDFKAKVDRVLSQEVKLLFENTVITRLDFEDFFKKFELKEDDFVFLDPPYDTEFSEYEEKQFSKQDQIRLAKCLSTLKAKFILIIKDTNFIYDLYSKIPNMRIKSFDKTYTYNVRGRNERNVKHLIITNF